MVTRASLPRRLAPPLGLQEKARIPARPGKELPLVRHGLLGLAAEREPDPIDGARQFASRRRFRAPQRPLARRRRWNRFRPRFYACQVNVVIESGGSCASASIPESRTATRRPAPALVSTTA
jgi:hypothetical protein